MAAVKAVYIGNGFFIFRAQIQFQIGKADQDLVFTLSNGAADFAFAAKMTDKLVLVVKIFLEKMFFI